MVFLPPLPYLFFLNKSPSSSGRQFLCCFLKVLSGNLSANVPGSRDLTVHHRDWLTHSGITDALVNSVIGFEFSQSYIPTLLTYSDP